MFNQDGFVFYDGFYGEPVFNFDIGKEREKVEYIKKHNINRISLDNNLKDFSFLQEIDFVEEVYISRNIQNEQLYNLKGLKRLVVNVEEGKPDLDYSKFQKLEILSIDWYDAFPDLSHNIFLKDLSIWKFKPKSKSLGVLKLPHKLEKLHITESNILNMNGLYSKNLKSFECYYCSSLESLSGISSISENIEIIILDYCSKLSNYEELGSCKQLNKIILGNCGNIKTLKWLNKLKKVKHFSFWGTKLIDGDVSPCFGIDFVSFKDAKNYNHKLKEFR